MRLVDRIRDGRLHRDESGTTLLELMVAMSLMVVFMGMFTGAMLLITKTVTKVEAISTTAAQADFAFQRLDKQIRYANAISTATFDSSGMWHVEWDSTRVTRPTGNDDSVTADDICNQLRVNPTTQKLEERSWRVVSASPGYDSLSSWAVLASNVTNGATSTDAPFGPPSAFASTAASARASVGLQQLTFNFVTTSPNVTTNTSTTSNYTFTALNSADALGSTAPVCQQVSVGATS